MSERGKIPEKTRRELSVLIDADPTIVQDLLQLAAESTTKFQEKLRRQRESAASNALTVLAGRPSKSMLLENPTWLLDFVYCQYPTDVVASRTLHDDALRDMFLKALQRSPLRPNFVRDTRGDAVADWYERRALAAVTVKFEHGERRGGVLVDVEGRRGESLRRLAGEVQVGQEARDAVTEVSLGKRLATGAEDQDER